ncbi:CapA family protein [Sediminitomix flava]|uniref:Capsule synthesis protein PGA_cap n=1 Tax=Sediminitomix flava TaxID=379075 RepID=A0A315ZIB3_SEDFL|nr:CapA family protein [Sediminitomix flava]PWJ44558.1 capsule synthesis protein PGA_cap [Sediminitomix flava]
MKNIILWNILLMAVSFGVKAQESTQTIKIVGVGDIMMGTYYPDESYLPPNDGKDIMKDVQPYLKDADITFGNLEGTFCDEEGEIKNCSNPKNCYAFKMPERYVKYLTESGFDVMSVANNHVNDFGRTGKQRTANALKGEDLYFAGLLEYPKTFFEFDGIRYGFAAFSPNTGTVSINQEARAEQIVKELAAEADIVIVSFHGGAEGSKYQHVTKKREIFLGENRGNVYEFSHRMIDAGADIVFGHGPHVTRGVDVYKDRFIAYSLGNFCTYGRFNLSGSKGIAPIIKLEVTPEGKFIEGKVISTRQIGEGIPKIDPSNRALKEIKALTATDFPEVPLEFQDDGTFRLIQQ